MLCILYMAQHIIPYTKCTVLQSVTPHFHCTHHQKLIAIYILPLHIPYYAKPPCTDLIVLNTTQSDICHE